MTRPPERQGVLLAELQHRVRNIMAIVQSMVSRTAANARTVEVYEANLSGRISAPARVQANLTRLLAKRGVPLVFLTGYDLGVVPNALRHVPRLEKPANPSEVIRTLAAVLEARDRRTRTGQAGATTTPDRS